MFCLVFCRLFVNHGRSKEGNKCYTVLVKFIKSVNKISSFLCVRYIISKFTCLSYKLTAFHLSIISVQKYAKISELLQMPFDVAATALARERLNELVQTDHFYNMTFRQVHRVAGSNDYLSINLFIVCYWSVGRVVKESAWTR